jgi:pimeloyl-ACP methyl ester carboxylesterase
MRTPSRSLAIALLLSTSLFAAGVAYDGANVHYESYGEGKEAVVFIHGWTCDLTFWRGQASVYEKHRSLLIDLPGHGQSDKPDVSYTQERFARAVEAAMRDAGVERAVLVGHSMGGPVGLTFVRLFPAKAKALVLVDAFVPKPPKDDADHERQKKQAENFLRTWRGPDYKESADKMIASMFSAKTTPPMREEIRSKMLSAPQHVMASAFEGMFAMEAPKPGETYSLPVMAIVVQTPSRAGYEAQLRTVFPNLRKYEGWEGSGHFLMMESPDRFNRSLDDFLASLK